MLPRFSVLISAEEDNVEDQGDGHLKASTGSQLGILPCLLDCTQRVREPIFTEMHPGDDLMGTSKVESVPTALNMALARSMWNKASCG